MSSKQEPGFEEALAKLTAAVRELEEGNLTLDESLTRYEQGIRHLSQCQKILTKAERKIEILSGVDAEGNPVVRRLDDDELTLDEKANNRSQRRSATGAAPARKRKKKASTQPESTPVADQDDVDLGDTLF